MKTKELQKFCKGGVSTSRVLATPPARSGTPQLTWAVPDLALRRRRACLRSHLLLSTLACLAMQSLPVVDDVLRLMLLMRLAGAGTFTAASQSAQNKSALPCHVFTDLAGNLSHSSN